jgi:hypothetical protein
MGHDASELLGSPQVAGVTVEGVGYARSHALTPGAAPGSPLGLVIGAKLVDPDGEQAHTPRFGAGFLAVTDSELALIGLQSTATRLVLGAIVERVQRADVASAELHGRFPVALLKIDFRKGNVWQVEVAAVHKRAARKVAAALNVPAAQV